MTDVVSIPVWDLPAGDQWVLELAFTAADGTTPVSQASYSFACKWRATPDASAALLSATVSNGGATGIVTFTVPATSTAALTPISTVYFDVDRYTTTTDHETVCRGTISLNYKVSR